MRLPSCRRPIKMSLLCQLEMTLPGGSAELAYEPSVLGQTTGAASWAGASGGKRALRRGAAPAYRPTPTMVTSLSGRNGDISIWRTHRHVSLIKDSGVGRPSIQGGILLYRRSVP